MQHEIKPVATFGDIIMVDGYDGHLFAVDAYDYSYRYEPDCSEVTIIYDLTCVYGNSGYIIAEQDEITLACREEKADAFLQSYKPAPMTGEQRNPSLMSSIFYAIGNGGEEVMTIQQPKVTEKVLTKQQRIDALLDERNDVGVLDGFIATQDAEYKQRRLDEIDAQLTELMAE